MRIVFMGTPEFSIPCLERLLVSQHQVVAVYTSLDKPRGRGRNMSPPPLKKVAESWQIPVIQVESFQEPRAVRQLANLHPDIVVVFAYGRILPKSVLAIPRFGCINIHLSLLPRFRGASPIAAAILAGDEFAGVSIILMDEELDAGPILSRAQIPIARQDTAGVLTTKLSLIAAHMIQEVLVYWLRGELTPQPQQSRYACYSKPISKKDGEIDWYLPAVDIWRRVRGFQPWPGAYTIWQGKKLKILEAVPLHGGRSMKVGQVINLSNDKKESPFIFGIAAGDGVLGICRVQLEGKRELPVAEFIRGQRQFSDMVLPS